MTSLIKIIAATLVSLLLFSCNFDVNFDQLNGEGEVLTKKHELENFNQIIVENGWDVQLIRSEKPRLVVKANENLHPVLAFSVKNKVLHITSKKNIGRADAKTIEVYFTGELQKISAQSGAEIVSGETFEQEKITLDSSSGAEIKLSLKTNNTNAEASSGAEIELSGTSENFGSEASSGSEIDAENLKTKTATANASSGAEITLFVSESLSADASSGGEVNYLGNPKNVSADNSISGDVNKR
ncbi:MAG TPA: head GIN domain-containing protein [Flavobacteriaceae bacterium]|nr:head GIN domain-containing protein [Flavobacteriaceae bacterium]